MLLSYCREFGGVWPSPPLLFDNFFAMDFLDKYFVMDAGAVLLLAALGCAQGNLLGGMFLVGQPYRGIVIILLEP